MIEGLKLTLTGEELRKLLEQRIERHRRSTEWWKREQARDPEQQTEEEPCLPSEMCANEAERHVWRTEVLQFISDHIDPFEVYRLGEDDLEFGELLPAKLGWIEQEEYEERTAIGFNLERLTQKLGEVPGDFAAAARRWDDADDEPRLDLQQ